MNVSHEVDCPGFLVREHSRLRPGPSLPGKWTYYGPVRTSRDLKALQPWWSLGSRPLWLQKLHRRPGLPLPHLGFFQILQLELRVPGPEPRSPSSRFPGRCGEVSLLRPKCPSRPTFPGLSRMFWKRVEFGDENGFPSVPRWRFLLVFWPSGRLGNDPGARLIWFFREWIFLCFGLFFWKLSLRSKGQQSFSAKGQMRNN